MVRRAHSRRDWQGGQRLLDPFVCVVNGVDHTCTGCFSARQRAFEPAKWPDGTLRGASAPSRRLLPCSCRSPRARAALWVWSVMCSRRATLQRERTRQRDLGLPFLSIVLEIVSIPRAHLGKRPPKPCRRLTTTNSCFPRWLLQDPVRVRRRLPRRAAKMSVPCASPALLSSSNFALKAPSSPRSFTRT